MGQKYTHYKRWEESTVVILHIYGHRTIFSLFCDHQDTESEFVKHILLYLNKYSPIKYIKVSMGQQHKYST